MAPEKIKLSWEWRDKSDPSKGGRYRKMFKGERFTSTDYPEDSRRNRSDAWGQFIEWRNERKAELAKIKASEVEEDHGIGSLHSIAVQNLGLHDVPSEEIERLRNTPRSKPELTAKAIADDYLSILQTKLKSGQASTGQYGVKRNAIEQFVEWYGAKRGLDTFDETDVKLLYKHMTDRIGRGENPTTIATYHGKMKQFIEEVAEENPDVPRPKNLRSKRYVIKPSKPKIEAFTIEDIKVLLELASPRVELWLLLMLNLGAYQSDISDLQANEVDWENGRIIRSRSKEANAPTINYPLWERTWELLQTQGNREGTVLTKTNGEPLVTSGIKSDGKEWRRDAIVSSWRHLVTKAKRPVRGEAAFSKDWHKTLKQFRKTASSLIETSPYAEFVDMFLDHTRVARRNYLVGQIVPKFDEAVKWLEAKIMKST